MDRGHSVYVSQWDCEHTYNGGQPLGLATQQRGEGMPVAETGRRMSRRKGYLGRCLELSGVIQVRQSD